MCVCVCVCVVNKVQSADKFMLAVMLKVRNTSTTTKYSHRSIARIVRTKPALILNAKSDGGIPKRGVLLRRPLGLLGNGRGFFFCRFCTSTICPR
jgi:hypothetical protein